MSTYCCKYEGLSGNEIHMHATYILGRLHSRINDSFHLITYSAVCGAIPACFIS